MIWYYPYGDRMFIYLTLTENNIIETISFTEAQDMEISNPRMVKLGQVTADIDSVEKLIEIGLLPEGFDLSHLWEWKDGEFIPPTKIRLLELKYNELVNELWMAWNVVNFQRWLLVEGIQTYEHFPSTPGSGMRDLTEIRNDMNELVKEIEELNRLTDIVV